VNAGDSTEKREPKKILRPPKENLSGNQSAIIFLPEDVAYKNRFSDSASST